ncbi:unnamed protein product [Orchesella dallaii]|uniref:Uncharacterized protein n=1 Tax=Orchesella dallaii TaxID=48710 RepID=A0ABP1PSJ8_9HEXA
MSNPSKELLKMILNFSQYSACLMATKSVDLTDTSLLVTQLERLSSFKTQELLKLNRNFLDLKAYRMRSHSSLIHDKDVNGVNT